MSYAVADDVNVLMGPHKVTASTAFTLTDLTAILLRLSARVDGLLSSVGLGVVPVVDDGSIETSILLAHLKTIVSWGGAAIAFRTLFPEAVGPGETPAFAYWDKKFTDASVRLAARNDIPRRLFGSRFAVSSYFTKSPAAELVTGSGIGLLAGRSLFYTDDLDVEPW